jgi:carboxynorspermidine decarboxylase
MNFQLIKNSLPNSPAFILNTDELVKNLSVLNSLRKQCGCKVLYSIKSLPLTYVMELAKPFIDGFSVSSLFEARLANEVLMGQGNIHLTTPGLRVDEWHEMTTLLTHISFNSLTQHQCFSVNTPDNLSIGLRINPKLSFLKDYRFDPCGPYSKLGVDIDELRESSDFNKINGLHIHNLFSATDFLPLLKTLEKLRYYFGKKLTQLDWINLGGGYLFNQISDQSLFIDLVKQLKQDYKLEIIIEPGKAVVDTAGYLVATVIDCFQSDGKTIAILDTSINHNPEVFEFQYTPELCEHDPNAEYLSILAGSTCLAGDVFGEYRFNTPLTMGDKVIFKQVGAYTLIKANRFNGYNFPDIYTYKGQQLEKIKHYSFKDYRQQWLTNS